jgi:polyferredoxin
MAVKTKTGGKRRILRFLVKYRIVFLIGSGVWLYMAIAAYNISLWWILLAGTILGLIFGKVFCRWVCPIGMVMEFLLRLSADTKVRQMYAYHKLGCPIAWVSGLLNRFSLFRIKLSGDSCTSCGICDKKCYIVAMEPAKYSLYKPVKANPGDSYTCSKCLACVAACPNGSLTYKIK